MSKDKHDEQDARFAHTHPHFAAEMDFSIHPDAEADPRSVTYPKDHSNYVEVGTAAVTAANVAHAVSDPLPTESESKEHVPANRP